MSMRNRIRAIFGILASVAATTLAVTPVVDIDAVHRVAACDGQMDGHDARFNCSETSVDGG